MNNQKDRQMEIDIADCEDVLLSFLVSHNHPKAQQSRTVDIYDALPKYLWSWLLNEVDINASVFSRECTLRGIHYKVEVTAANIEIKKDGKSQRIFKFPGEREEHVEDALRMLAATGAIRQFNGKAGVTFTLYQLQKELKAHKHSYSLSEIKEALTVLNKAVLTIYSSDGKSNWSSNFFPQMGLTTREDFKENGAGAFCYVEFHPLVNRSIIDQSFRRLNYSLATSIKSPLARYMYKRMNQYWKQASSSQHYNFKLVSFLRQTPRGLSSTMANNTRAIREALKALKDKSVIESYSENLIKDGRKIVDAEYSLKPHPFFAAQTIESNSEMKKIRARTDAKALIVASDER